MKKMLAKMWLTLMGTALLTGFAYMCITQVVFAKAFGASAGVVAVVCLTLWAYSEIR